MQFLLEIGPDPNVVLALMVLLALGIITAVVYTITHNKRNRVLKAENERLKNLDEKKDV